MKMYTRFLVMVLGVIVFLLAIFSRIDSHVGIRSISMFDDVSREKAKSKNEDKGKQDKFEKRKVERSESKQDAAKVQDAPKVISKARQPDSDKSVSNGSPPEDAQETFETSKDSKGAKEQVVKRPVTLESNQLVLVTNKPSGALKNLKYPDWWTNAWSHSATSGQGQIFVGDKPLFPPCQDTAVGKTSKKMYSFEEPRNYISNTKNPCWYDKPDMKRGFRCLPYFYIAGVAKCGTTDMNYRLMLHPDVMKGTMKEYHWWDRYRFEALHPGSHKKGGLESGPVPFNLYIRMIMGKRDIAQMLEDLKTQGKSEKIFGDASPSYLWDMHYWGLLEGNEGCSEPRIVIGQHIHHVYPHAKMILIFRNPTPRLYSRFLSRIPRTPSLKGSTSESFHQMVMKSVQLYRDCFARWSVRHCAYNQTLRSEAVVRLSEGMYPVYMADWLRIFPRDNMLLLRYEDYAKDMPAVMREIFDFLGLAPINGTQYETEILTESVHNPGTLYIKLGPMKPETEAILNEFYAPFVNKFAEILNDERFLWLDTVKKT